MDTISTTAGRPRRVLVTGAAGFIGSHLVEALLAAGNDVIGIDAFVDSYSQARKCRNLEVARTHPGFTFGEVDLRTDELRPWLEDVDVVVNEAAFAGLPRSWTDLDAYVGCNVLAVERLVTAALASEVDRFVQVSTSSVYGFDAVGDETTPTRPVSPYGITKLAAEQLVQAHVLAHDLPATILRYFSIYGPRQRPDMAYHIFVERLRRGQPLTVYGDGRQSRSNTYVDDCVRGTVAAIDGAEVGEVYNVGGGEEIELLEAIEVLADALGTVARIEHGPPRIGDQRRTCADTSRARDAFGYVAQVSPAEGLRRQVEWHLAELTAAPSTTPLVTEAVA